MLYCENVRILKVSGCLNMASQVILYKNYSCLVIVIFINVCFRYKQLLRTRNKTDFRKEEVAEVVEEGMFLK